MCHAARYGNRSIFVPVELVPLALAALSFVTSPVWAEVSIDEATDHISTLVTMDSETPSPPADTPAASMAPTHRQTAVIRGNVSGQPNVSLTCFCVTPDDRIVAGCTGQSNELRVFDTEGNYLETWSTPVAPEAIFVCDDGRILVAGEGQIVRLTSDGQVELQKQSAHAAAVDSNPDKIREEVIAQAKQRAEQMANQSQVFDQMIERADEEIAKLKQQIAALDEAADGDPADAEESVDGPAGIIARLARPLRPRANRQMLEQRITMMERTKEQYKQIKEQLAEREATPAAEPSEEEIEQMVRSSIAYKLKASSISASGGDVFLATRALAGYGYEIWRMDEQFENGTQIVSELRGCCGQMDVKASEHGVFVAENSRYRVCRYDREGKLVTTWGHSAREGIEGFGSCCNPMNVAIGPDDSVYTAEDTTGRIKRYSVDGKMLALIGAVDLVPGCKNVSIAASADGSRVYMLDITRHHIVRLDARSAEEIAADSTAATTRSGGAGAVLRGLLSFVVGSNDE